MKRWTLSMMCVVILLGIGLTASLVMAGEDEQLSVSVAFGRGLNTAQAGNKVNHVILPNNIKVHLDGVVHFLVAGFHQPILYKPGTELEKIQDFASALATTVTFINFAPDEQVFYRGINPAGGPQNTQATPDNPIITGSDTRSNAQNRVETVGFPALEGVSPTGVVLSAKAEPGIYLLICNVRGHFLDGMFAFVEVEAN
jgi:hypothetical protein